MRSPEGKTSVRKTPERKKARDYIEELPPKLSKLSQSAMKILSPIRPPKTSENIRTALSEKAPRYCLSFGPFCVFVCIMANCMLH